MLEFWLAFVFLFFLKVHLEVGLTYFGKVVFLGRGARINLDSGNGQESNLQVNFMVVYSVFCLQGKINVFDKLGEGIEFSKFSQKWGSYFSHKKRGLGKIGVAVALKMGEGYHLFSH